MKVKALETPAVAVDPTHGRCVTRDAGSAGPQANRPARRSSPKRADVQIDRRSANEARQNLAGPQGKRAPGFGLREAGTTRSLHPAGVAEFFANQTLAARVDALCERWNKPDSPGCVIAVMRGDETLLRAAYGMANLEAGVPLSTDTVFRIASASKQFTAYCVLLLARDQWLSLDDEIHQYLPDLPPTPEPITIRHLLHHVGGLREYIELLELRGQEDSDPLTDAEVLGAIQRQQGVNDLPGRRFLYSNTGYYLLGRIAEQVSGKSLRELAEEQIFAPLGMSHTEFGDEREQQIPHRARAYSRTSDEKFQREGTSSQIVGDGGLLTTVGDMCRWERHLAQPAAGHRATVELMEQPGRLNDGTPLEYACGLELGELRGRKLISHSGSFAGYRAEALRIPDAGLTVVCLANTNDASPAALARQVATLALDPSASLDEVPPVVWGPGAAREWTGFYRDAETGLLAAVRSRGGQLEIHLPGGEFALQPVAQGLWLADDDDESFEIRPAREGGTGRWSLAVGGAHQATYEALEPDIPRTVPLTAYAGAFASDEVGATYQVELEGEQLLLQRGPQTIGPFEPVADDLFWSTGMTLAFRRDEAGKILGYHLSTNGARGLWFAKSAQPASSSTQRKRATTPR